METITITAEKAGLDFGTAKKITGDLAKGYNPEASLMAWYDKKQDKYSPSKVECDAEGLPGWEEYGWHHGRQKKIVVNNGGYIFIYT